MRQVRSEIRRAEAANICPIERLVADAYAPYVARIGTRPLPMDDDYAARVARGEAWVTGDIDGLLVLVPATGYLLIDNVAVRPDVQGRGLGRQLIAFAEETARTLGFGEVRLYTNEQMSENRRFYSWLGYVELGRETIRGRRAVWMKKAVGRTNDTSRSHSSARLQHVDRDAVILIRAFDEADRDAVVALWKDCDLVRPWNDPGKDIERKLYVRGDMFLVATDGNEIVGSVMAGYEGHRGWINYLAVHPAWRRRGIARRLMAEAERLLAASECPKVNLQVRSENGDVLAFYRAVGYTVDDVVSLGKRLVQDGIDESDGGV